MFKINVELFALLLMSETYVGLIRYCGERIN